MQMADLVGSQIILLLAERPKLLRANLVGADVGGIWIESQEITNDFLGAISAVASERTPTIFVPYCRIVLAMSTMPGFALGEKSFGV
jgi:hypothetical protein